MFISNLNQINIPNKSLMSLYFPSKQPEFSSKVTRFIYDKWTVEFTWCLFQGFMVILKHDRICFDSRIPSE